MSKVNNIVFSTQYFRVTMAIIQYLSYPTSHEGLSSQVVKILKSAGVYYREQVQAQDEGLLEDGTQRKLQHVINQGLLEPI